ncbi:type II toxin-antitoxin system PemK/MazF family toxin [Brachybacterium alimentarium]|uniref:type II toxin-antitoxin system PemK/MazF family toxin n=1 Tax=Brachybacterium alimentarium TaxID=47845 RepID=UPI003FD2B5D1
MSFVRGSVYWADIGYGEKPWVVVSNNARNNALRSALVARLTTTSKPPLDSIVVLDHTDAPFVGSVLCDDIETLHEDDQLRYGGALPPATIMRIDKALRVAFALR